MTNNEHTNVKPEVAEDFKRKLEKLKGKENLDTSVQILIGKTTKALEKFKVTGPASTYELLLENMAMMTLLYNKNNK